MTKGRKKRKVVPLLDLAKERVVKLEAQGEELLPGIPNEITLGSDSYEASKLEGFSRSLISTSWLATSLLESPGRARSNSTETLAVICHDIDSSVSAIALYSVRDEPFWEVHPIPQLGGIRACSQCVSLDGKLYVLGGVKDSQTELASDEVYVLDLAGQRGWRRCASMLQLRQRFGCGVMNGKIYACGGLSLFEPVSGAEVYDPQIDAWSPLPPMHTLRFDHRVTHFGEHVIVLGGNVFDPNYMDWKDDRKVDANGDVTDLAGTVRGPLSDYYFEEMKYLEVYGQNEEEWQLMGNHVSNFMTKDLMFAKKGIYLITWRDIYGQEGEDRMTHLHSLSSKSSIKSRYADSLMPFVPFIVDDELLAVVHWDKSFVQNTPLIKTRGFCSGKKKIAWEDAHWSRSRENGGFFMNCIMCTVRLCISICSEVCSLYPRLYSSILQLNCKEILATLS